MGAAELLAAACLLLAATAFAAERSITLPHRGKRQAAANEGAVKTTLGPRGRNALAGPEAKPAPAAPNPSAAVVGDQPQKDKPKPRSLTGH